MMETYGVFATFVKVISIIVINFRQTCAIHSIYMPEVDELSYVVDGDIMLGIATVLTRFDDSTPCGVTVTRTGVSYLQAKIYAMRKINEDPHLLANISLGVVAMDSCGKDQFTIARSLQLLPKSAFKCDKDACPKTSKDIVGVLGDVFNPSTIILAKIFQLFQIPLVSPFATSNQLSDKKEYPYFLRVLPPTKYEIQSILEIIRYFNWTYVSAIFMDDDSGRDGEANLREFADNYGICVAYTTLIRRRASPEDLEAISLMLTYKSKARVVLLLGDYRTIRSILVWARESGRMGYFIWFISRNFNPSSDYYEDVAGAFVADMDVRLAADFYADYMRFTGQHQDIANLPKIWNNGFIESSFNCSFDSTSEKLPCANFLDTEFSKMTSIISQRNLFSKAVDAVYLYAHGLDRLIKENCDDARIYKDKLKDCINGPLLFEYMKNETFEGVGGNITLNDDGDNVEEFFISQWQYDDKGVVRRVRIGKWLMENSGIEVYPENVGWYRGGKFRQDLTVPTSVCSVECGPDEFRIQLDQKCCWECKKCHVEERLVNNGTKCELCPEFTWPNQTHYRSCDPVTPVFLTWFDVVGVTLTITAALGASTTTFILVLCVVNRKERLIKASSRELSMIMGVGLLLSYLSVYPVVAKPTASVCWVQRLSFSITYAVVYSPMLVKSSRIYRIFYSGSAGNRRPKFISTRAQIVFSAVAIMIQVSIGNLIL
jgi:metabotropic glutamate receptor 2/3/metabotropic glutamate receptor 6/7/8